MRRSSEGFALILSSTNPIGLSLGETAASTRGTVLLLLDLELDDSGDRPLIIDQPEGNLDPKSVFDELVTLFTAAKTKRQAIMVTHNANRCQPDHPSRGRAASLRRSAADHLRGGRLGECGDPQGCLRHSRGRRSPLSRTHPTPSRSARPIGHPDA